MNDYDRFRDPMYGRSGPGYDKLNIEKEIEKLFEFFPTYKNKATIQRWSQRLAEKKMTPQQVARAVETVVATQSKICSIAELESIIYNQDPHRADESLKQDAEVASKAEKLRKWSKDQLDMILEHHTMGEIEAMMMRWWNEVYGGVPGEFADLTLQAFLPIFLQDLKAASWDLDKAIEMAVESKLPNPCHKGSVD